MWQAEAARTGEEGVSDQFGEEGLARTGEKSGAGMDRRKVGVWTGSGRWFFSSWAQDERARIGRAHV